MTPDLKEAWDPGSWASGQRALVAWRARRRPRPDVGPPPFLGRHVGSLFVGPKIISATHEPDGLKGGVVAITMARRGRV